MLGQKLTQQQRAAGQYRQALVWWHEKPSSAVKRDFFICFYIFFIFAEAGVSPRIGIRYFQKQGFLISLLNTA